MSRSMGYEVLGGMETVKAVLWAVVGIWRDTARQVLFLTFYGYFLAGGLFHVWVTRPVLALGILEGFQGLCVINSVLFAWRAYRSARAARVWAGM